MTIPATATQAGKMEGFMPHLDSRYAEILAAWQAAINEKHYNADGFTYPADKAYGSFGHKYARLNVGGSGAFMVEIESGIIYGIRGYGKVDKKKVSGNIYDPAFNASVLVRDRFRYGHFENNADGSLRQSIVRR